MDLEVWNIIDIKNDIRIIDVDKFIDCLCLVMVVGVWLECRLVEECFKFENVCCLFGFLKVSCIYIELFCMELFFWWYFNERFMRFEFVVVE